MKVFHSVREFTEWRRALGGTLGFVPTMGNLHRGHASLVKRSVAQDDHTVVSIFINPTQFNSPSDYEKYPQTLAEDLELLNDLGVDAVFAPTASEMYPGGFAHKVVRTDTQHILCDAHRPGHFDGVLTVVNKLFAIVRPDNAFFGEKDFQQLLYIEEMARDLFTGVNVVRCPTEREKSGLALSSRNNRLSVEARERAAKVYQWIHYDRLSLNDLAERMKLQGMELEYFEEHWGRRFVAFWIEGVRLIDNFDVAEEKRRQPEEIL
jgi:pantoate--beta-alanine ligase